MVIYLCFLACAYQFHTQVQWVCPKGCRECSPNEGCNSIWLVDNEKPWVHMTHKLTKEEAFDVCQTLKYKGVYVGSHCTDFWGLKDSLKADLEAAAAETDSESEYAGGQAGAGVA